MSKPANQSARIPNLPFFYLVYRAWSHWRALSGGRHVQWLVENKLVQIAPSEELDKLYENPTRDEFADGKEDKEKMLIKYADAPKISRALEIPELELELERAVWQVETALEKQEKESARKETTASTKQPEAEKKE